MNSIWKNWKNKLGLGLLAFTLGLTSFGTAAFIVEATTNMTPKFVEVAVNQTTGKRYTKVEDALFDAKSGQNVFIIPGTHPTLYGKNNDPAYTTIKEGVNFNVPYALNEDGTPVGNSATATETGAALAKDTPSKMKSNFTIAAGVTLNNYGNITIGGVLSGGGGANSGQTSGNYAKITMKENSILNCGNEDKTKSGRIFCYGYIMDGSSDVSLDDPQVNIYNGYAKLPFIVKDFRGGTQSVLCVKAKAEVSPFNQYEIQNIEAKIRVDYGSQLIAYCNLYAASQQHATEGVIVGKDSKSLVELSKGAFFYSKYNPKTCIADIDIYGGAKMNSLELNVGIAGVGTISTKDVFFPITWRHRINLHPLSDRGISTYKINNKVKMMPGSYLRICKGASLTADLITSYDLSGKPGDVRQDPGYNDSKDAYTGTKYVANMPYDAKNPQNNNAQIIVDGSLELVGFGGFAQTANKGAILTIKKHGTISAKEISNGNPGNENAGSALTPWATPASVYAINNPSRGYQDASLSTISNFDSSTMPINLISSGKYWSDASQPYNVVYKQFFDDGTGVKPFNDSGNPNVLDPSQSITLKNPASVPTGYSFAGWYLGNDAELSMLIRNSLLFGSTGLGWLDENKTLNVYAFITKAKTVNVKFLYEGTHPSLDASKTNVADFVSILGVETFSPSKLDVAFNPDVSNGGTNVADLVHTLYNVDTWTLLDNNKQVIQQGISDSFVIDTSYTADVVYISPNPILLFDTYKVTASKKAPVSDHKNFGQFTINIDFFGYTKNDIKVESFPIWLPLNALIIIDLSTYKQVNGPYGSLDKRYEHTQVSVYDQFGTLIDNVKDPNAPTKGMFENWYGPNNGNSFLVSEKGVRISISEDWRGHNGHNTGNV